jgi:hypothetical protein
VCVVLWGLCSSVRRQEQQSENGVLVEVAWDGLSAEGESPVDENTSSVVAVSPSSSGPVESAVNLPGPPGKPEYFPVTDSGLVP